MTRFTPITPKYIPKGVRLCIENARRLMDDAILLHKEKKFPSSIVCSILAFEEIAKARMLRTKWIKGKNVKANDWKELTHHLSKNKHGFRFLHEGTLYFNSLKNFKDLQQNIIKNSAKRSNEDKENFSFVNWTGLGWTAPLNPEPLQFYFDKESRLQNWSTDHLSKSEQYLTKFKEETQTKKILDIEVTESIDPYKADKIVRNILPEIQLGVKQFEITHGEVTRLILDSNLSLTINQQKSVEKIIRKKFPFYKN